MQQAKKCFCCVIKSTYISLPSTHTFKPVEYFTGKSNTFLKLELARLLDYHVQFSTVTQHGRLVSKYGTLLLRQGVNVKNILHTEYSIAKATVEKLEETCNSLDKQVSDLAKQQCPDFNAMLSVVAENLNSRLQELSDKFKEKYKDADLSNFDISNAVSEVDPILWNFVFFSSHRTNLKGTKCLKINLDGIDSAWIFPRLNLLINTRECCRCFTIYVICCLLVLDACTLFTCY